MQKETTLSKNDNMRNKYVRVAECAEFLGVSTHHVYRLVKNRTIPFYKSAGGKIIYFSLDDLQKYVTHCYFPPMAEVQEKVDKQILKSRL